MSESFELTTQGSAYVEWHNRAQDRTPAAAFAAGWQGRDAEVERLRRENGVLRDVIAMTDPCIHQAILDAQQAHANGQTITLEEYMATRGLSDEWTSRPSPASRPRWLGRGKAE